MIIPKNVTPIPKKAPKSPAAKKRNTATKSPGGNKDIFEVKEFADGTISRSHVSAVVKAAVKLGQRNKKQKSNLFEGDGKSINVQIGGIKIPKESRSHTLKCTLPHEVCNGSLGVALFVKDLSKDFKQDHEPTVHHYNELLSSNNSKSLVSEVIPLRGLKSEYQTFELKRRLSNKYDKFLADKRILHRLPLGKFFYNKRKIPIPVDMESKNLNEELKQALHTSILPLNHKGMSSILTVGSTAMKMEDVVDNVMKFIEIIKVKYPGGWKNVRSLHIKTESSPSIPLHVSTISVKDVGYVDAQKPKRKMKKPEVDELSTLPGARVKVLADGTVKVKRVVDPNWDMKHGEPHISEDEEDEENKEKKKQVKGKKEDMKKKDKSKLASNKKRGRDALEAEDIPSKKFKKIADDDEDESEDEQMYQNELNFMKRMAQEEEELERKNKEAPADDEVADTTKVVVDQEMKENEDNDDMDESVVDDICLKDKIPLQETKVMKISRKEKNKNGKSKKQRANESKSKSAKKSGGKSKFSGKKSPAASFKSKKGKK
uniref:Ribosomal L1 domaincontaining protein 1like [Megachile rotundata] n=1 Tax=Lepeophtheirus salmonis TaxID=72036 RepID=A0A0K2VBS3_LEPSM